MKEAKMVDGRAISSGRKRPRDAIMPVVAGAGAGAGDESGADSGEISAADVVARLFSRKTSTATRMTKTKRMRRRRASERLCLGRARTAF